MNSYAKTAIAATGQSATTNTMGISSTASTSGPLTLGGGGGAGGVWPGAGGLSGATWTSNTTLPYNSAKVKIEGTGLILTEDADITIGNRSLKTFIDKLEDRLAILQPDFEKIERFAALRKAYDNYKLMEQLCHIDNNEEEKK